MSIKKELLQKLTEQQLTQLAASKGIKFKLNKTQRDYYADWEEKDKIIDINYFVERDKINTIRESKKIKIGKFI